MTVSSDKSPSQRAFSHYLRTGRRLPKDIFIESQDIELKFNPYHDPRNGQFTFAPGGARTGTGTGTRPALGQGRPHPPAKPGPYTVRSGDTLSHIARRHGVRTDTLARANNIKNPDHIQAGQRLHIPKDAPPPARAEANAPGKGIADVGKTAPDIEVRRNTSARVWPVIGGGRPAKKGAIGPNKKPYSDGRYDPSGAYRNGRPHYGIDLPTTAGDSVQAAASGKIYYAKAIPGYGNTVAILHPDGNVSLYAHLQAFGEINIGAPVAKGDVIGFVGNSGNAFNRGTHLHFEVRKFIGKDTLGKVSNGARPIDPTKWLLGK